MKYFKRLFLNFLIAFAVLAGGGCAAFYNSAANKPLLNTNSTNAKPSATAKTKNNKPMTINFGKISFTVPAGFPVPDGYGNGGASSEYEKRSQFVTPKTAAIAESLEVGTEFESTKTLAAITSEVKENMENTGVYKIEKEIDRTVDDYPAKILKASAENEREPKVYVYIAHIKSGENKFVRIYFDTERDAADSQKMFDSIISSATFNRHNAGKPKTPTPENFRRFDAGDVSLDVPTTMPPKQTQTAKSLRIEQFPEQTWNVEQIVFTIEYFGEDNIGSKQDLVKEIEKFQAPDAVAGRSDDSFDTGNFKGKTTRLTLNVPELENAEGKTAVLLAEGKTKDDTVVQLKGESPFSKRVEMESGFREILNSVKSQQ